MQLVAWDPFREMRELSEEMDRLFNESLSQRGFLPSRGMVVPQADVSHDAKKVSVEIALPGFSPDDVEISVSDDVLTVSGKSKRERETKKKNYYHKEISTGSFSRSVVLPALVKSDQAKAEFEDGILKVEIPKQEPKKVKVVKVKPQLKSGKKAKQ